MVTHLLRQLQEQVTMIKNSLFLTTILSTSFFFCSEQELTDLTNTTISAIATLSSSDSSLQYSELRRTPKIPLGQSNASLQEEVEEYFQKVIAPTIKMVESFDSLEDLN